MTKTTSFIPENRIIIYKPQNRKETIKRIRKNGTIELESGGMINPTEFSLNWKYS